MATLLLVLKNKTPKAPFQHTARLSSGSRSEFFSVSREQHSAVVNVASLQMWSFQLQRLLYALLQTGRYFKILLDVFFLPGYSCQCPLLPGAPLASGKGSSISQEQRSQCWASGFQKQSLETHFREKKMWKPRFSSGRSSLCWEKWRFSDSKDTKPLECGLQR